MNKNNSKKPYIMERKTSECCNATLRTLGVEGKDQMQQCKKCGTKYEMSGEVLVEKEAVKEEEKKEGAEEEKSEETGEK